MSQSGHKSSAGSEPDPFQPMPRLRTSERIARIIRNTILEGRLHAGEVLPPERTLAQRFQVTRNTVREALRQLEQLRLVSIRQGSGVTVRDYHSTAGLELLGTLLAAPTLGGGWLADVLEARRVIGKAICRHAIERIDPSGVDALQRAVEAFAAEAAKAAPDAPTLQRLDFDVHAALIHGGGNRAIIFLHNSLRQIYEPVAHLFEDLVGEPAALCELYGRLVNALHRGDRIGAKAAFDAVFELGGVSPDLQPNGASDAQPT